MGIRDFFDSLWGTTAADHQEDHRDYEVIGSFDGHDVGKGYNVIGDPEAAKAHEYFEEHDEDYSSKRFPDDEQYLDIVNPNLIEGIKMSGARTAEDWLQHGFGDVPIADPNDFWGMSGHTHDEYLELTSHIPEINTMLEGKTPDEQSEILRSMCEDPQLGPCAQLCFSPEKRVKVWEMGDIYEFDEDGRHRVLAARENLEFARNEAEQNGEAFDESKYFLPVKVVGAYTPSIELDDSYDEHAPSHSHWDGYEATGGERPNDSAELWRSDGAPSVRTDAQAQSSMSDHPEGYDMDADKANQLADEPFISM